MPCIALISAASARGVVEQQRVGDAAAASALSPAGCGCARPTVSSRPAGASGCRRRCARTARESPYSWKAIRSSRSCAPTSWSCRAGAAGGNVAAACMGPGGPCAVPVDGVGDGLVSAARGEHQKATGRGPDLGPRDDRLHPGERLLGDLIDRRERVERRAGRLSSLRVSVRSPRSTFAWIGLSSWSKASSVIETDLTRTGITRSGPQTSRTSGTFAGRIIDEPTSASTVPSGCPCEVG